MSILAIFSNLTLLLNAVGKQNCNYLAIVGKERNATGVGVSGSVVGVSGFLSRILQERNHQQCWKCFFKF